MHPSIRSRLAALMRAQWAGLLALFLVIAGGTAYAADTIGSSDIIDESILSQDIKNGDVKASEIGTAAVLTAEVGNNQIRSADVRDDTLAGGGLTGADITNQSGVDTCTHGSVRFGELCVGVANEHHNWYAANALCAGLELRLPTLGEAQALALNHQLPGLDDNNLEYFWTDEVWAAGGNPAVAYIVNEAGDFSTAGLNDTNGETVCVTTPTN